MFKNTKLIHYGSLLFDYVFLSLLLITSLATIVLFVPVYTGVISYFIESKDKRNLNLIFKTMKGNITVLAKVSLLFTVTVIAIITNLYILNDGQTIITMMMNFMSYLAMIIVLHIVIYAPIIMIKMNVKLSELIINSIQLVFGGFKRHMGILMIIIFWSYLITQMFIVLYLGIYFVVYVIAKFTYTNFKNLKEKMI